jgi:hypothetical protein
MFTASPAFFGLQANEYGGLCFWELLETEDSSKKKSQQRQMVDEVSCDGVISSDDSEFAYLSRAIETFLRVSRPFWLLQDAPIPSMLTQRLRL